MIRGNVHTFCFPLHLRGSGKTLLLFLLATLILSLVVEVKASPEINVDLPSLKAKAESGDAASQFNLGEAYRNGRGGPKDLVQAVKWYRKAADQGNALAQVSLGLIYTQGGWQVVKTNSGESVEAVIPQDNNEAVKWYRKAADQGNASGQWALGDCYQNGEGVSKDINQAIALYQKAADQGEPNAEYSLACAYGVGIGVPQDFSQAAMWLQKSAEQGNFLAQFNLGRCYASGTGVPKDDTEAVKWWRKAADQGNADAQCFLGVSYEEGKGVNKDTTEAIKWYLKSAAKGNVLAERSLGIAYSKGVGVTKDEFQAVKWYTQAANQGDDCSQDILGVDYQYGLGLNADAGKAFSLYQKAAKKGNVDAENNLGLLYCEGLGVIKNEVEGLAWLYVASANGDVNTAQHLNSYERQFGADLVTAARNRAVEIQTQMSASNGGSTISSNQPIASSDSAKATGSGSFLTEDGYVLTAAHVVQGAMRLEIVTATGKLPATVIKVDATSDVALLKCAGSNFTPLPIAPSKDARVGAEVFTMGFPNVQIQGFDPKLTKGEISSLSGLGDNPQSWQISVPIQPGNSGGPLCDENGNLIGIVVSTLDPLKMAKLAGEIPQNVNYAVKSSYILPLLEDLKNLPRPRTSIDGKKFEDIVETVRPSTVLIIVY